MIVRRLLSRTTIAVLTLALATGTVLSTTAQASPGRPGPVQVGVPTQLGSRADTNKCLTYVAAEGVPMAVMLGCNPEPTNQVQNWTYTASGQLMVSLSKSVGGEIAATGACLDTAADLATVPDDATILVLPCRSGAGQKWSYDNGTFANLGNGLALTSMAGLTKQAQPVGVDPADGSAAQTWQDLPVPQVDLLSAIAALLHAILDALGLELPLPVETAAHDLLAMVSTVQPVPQQLQVLPKQILDSVR